MRELEKYVASCLKKSAKVGMGRKLVDETSKTPAKEQLQKQEKELKKRLNEVDQVLGPSGKGRGGRKSTEKSDISVPSSAEKPGKPPKKSDNDNGSDSSSDSSSSDSESSDSDSDSEDEKPAPAPATKPAPAEQQSKPSSAPAPVSSGGGGLAIRKDLMPGSSSNIASSNGTSGASSDKQQPNGTILHHTMFKG